MRYLDEEIIVNIQDLPVHPSQTYKYKILIQNAIIFFGRVYLEEGESSVDIDITEILRSVKHRDSVLTRNPFRTDEIVHNQMENVLVQVEINGNTYSNDVDVAFIYRYPDRLNYLESDLVMPNTNHYEIPMLQGSYLDSNNNWQLRYKPRIPYVLTDKIGFGLMSNLGTNEDRYFKFDGKIKGDDIFIDGAANQIFTYYSRLSELFADTRIYTGFETINVMQKQATINEIYGDVELIGLTGFTTTTANFDVTGLDKDNNVIFIESFTTPDTQQIDTVHFLGNPELNSIRIGDETNYVVLNLGAIFRKDDADFKLSFNIRERSGWTEITGISINCYSPYELIPSNQLLSSEFRLDIEEQGMGYVSLVDEFNCIVGHLGQQYGEIKVLVNGDSSNKKQIIKIDGNTSTFNIGWSGDEYFESVLMGDTVNSQCFCGISGHDINIISNPDNYFILYGNYTTRISDDEIYFNDMEIIGWELRRLPKPESKSYLKMNDSVLAEIDTCPGRYYLQWLDRFGSVQMQEFKYTSTFKNSYDTVLMRSYSGYAKPIGINVTPSWTLNSDWIEEENYPYYESIFVSPIIVLYDVREDKSYRVIITDSEYTEKTYKNSRSLFNITLNLEQSNKQNIIA